MKLKKFILRRESDNLEVAVAAPNLKAAIDRCSGPAENWEFVRETEEDYVLAPLAAAIAAELPGQWAIEPNSDEYANCNFYLVRADGMKLMVAAPSYSHKNKFHIFLSPPRDDGQWIGVYVNGTKLECPSINVSETKSPVQIARDIERRLLPDAEIYFAEANQILAKRNAAADKQRQNIIAVCNALGRPPIERYGKLQESFYHENLDVIVNVESVSIKGSFNIDKALAILNFIKTL